MKSPSLIVWPLTSNVFAAKFTMISPAPETHGQPIPRATTAAWLVIPPRHVTTPLETAIPPMSSGEVSVLTRMTSLPCFAHSSASSAVNTTCPHAPPGDALRPIVIGLMPDFFISFWSRIGAKSLLNSPAGTRDTAVLLSMSPSSTISTCERSQLKIVLFPLLV